MMHSTLKRVARSLQRLDGPGSFSAYHLEPGRGLHVDVDDVGRVEFPIAGAEARALIERAAPSPFGYRDQTLHDPLVRDSWEIPGARVRLDPSAWSRRFERGVARVTEGLGFPADAVVTPTLQKLLIYGPGQFFAPHRDTEKDPTMWGTLVVLLPSGYRGGEMVVAHAGQRVTYDTAADAARGRVGFLGFYGDCVHETTPVRSGHRVALTYGLNVENLDSAPRPDDVYGDLQQSVASFFSRESAERGSAGWLVYLLEHEYSLQSLGWSRLKNSDRARVDAFREVADALECDCFLAVADVQESYSVDEEGRGGERDGMPPGGYGMLQGVELSLDRWLDSRGQPCVGSSDYADERCIVTTVASEERDAYRRCWSPWTGNEGGYAAQWYYQAALVMIPRGSEVHAEVAAPRADVKPRRAATKSATVRRRKKSKTR